MRFYIKDLIPNNSKTLSYMILVFGKRLFTLKGLFLLLLMLQINDMLIANSFIADKFIADKFVNNIFCF